MRDPAVQQQLNRPFDATDENFNMMFEELGWLAPFYLKLIANEVRPSIARTTENFPQATSADFTAAFDALLEPNRQSEFGVWREHINKNLPASDSGLAMKLLHAISQTSNGEIFDTLIAVASEAQKGTHKRQVRDILSILLNDGLIALSKGRYQFRSGLIRRYWKEYEAE